MGKKAAEVNVALFATNRRKFHGLLFSPEQSFIILALLSENMLDAVDDYVACIFNPTLFNQETPSISTVIKAYETHGWIKQTSTGIEMRSKWTSIFERKSKVDTTTKTWISEYCELFPDNGTKLVGYPIRMSTDQCLAKMIKFVRNTKFSKEVILAATKIYIRDREKYRYAYIQNSLNFIEHSTTGGSLLATFCEEYERKASATDQIAKKSLPGQDVC